MSAAAAALNALYGIDSTRLGNGFVTMFASGGSLALLAATLNALAVVSTLGAVLARRSVGVVRNLAS
jgi:hypothetical protein